MKTTWGHLTFTRWCKICRKKFTANSPNAKFCRSECKEISDWMWKRNHALKKLYGIDEEEYLSMLKKQNGRCAICETQHPGADKTNFSVDHCHKTGKIRGLLCGSCNSRLGTLEDKEWCDAALIYLSLWWYCGSRTRQSLEVITLLSDAHLLPLSFGACVISLNIRPHGITVKVKMLRRPAPTLQIAFNFHCMYAELAPNHAWTTWRRADVPTPWCYHRTSKCR